MSSNFIFTQDGQQISFDDVFVPAKIFQQGSTWGWGLNVNAQLGVNDLTTRSTPTVLLSGAQYWKEICNARFGGYGVSSDGQLFSWGNNSYGQLGIGPALVQATTPVLVSGDKTWRSVSVGAETFTAAIKTDGTLWMWGNNQFGQLGINNVVTRSTPVTTFAGGGNWKQVSCGRHFAAAIKTDGTLWTWGNNYAGRLGIGTALVPPLVPVGIDSPRSTPVTTIAGGNDWKSVSCGYGHALAIKNNGTLWAWGVNDRGQCAQNPNTHLIVSIPTIIEADFVWRTASAGRNHSAAIKDNGSLWVWGYNDNGQLGVGATGYTPTTTKLILNVDPGFDTFTINLHGYVVGQEVVYTTPGAEIGGLSNGSYYYVIPTGPNTFKLATSQTNALSSISIDVTSFPSEPHRLGSNFVNVTYSSPFQLFRADFGNNYGSGNWKDVACGQQHTIALKSDGTLWAWGFNSNGQIGIGDTSFLRVSIPTQVGTANDWRKVSLGAMSLWSLASKYDGTVINP